MPETGAVAKNLKRLREANGFTQDKLADYLKIGRSAYSNYECGERETPLEILERLANLYGCELYTLYDENQDVIKGVLATAFRVDNLSSQDMAQIAAFKRVVMNYLKMDMLLKK